MTATDTVVAGTDGSPGSRTALEYALRDVARRGAQLLVVTVVKDSEYLPGFDGSTSLQSPYEVMESVKAAARQQLDEVRAAHPELAAVPVTVKASIGPPGPILAAAAEGAVLLVIGHRGRGPVRSALLGSVGLYCVLHATCPVTIVPQVPLAEPVSIPAAAAAVSRA
jgi:nucleotide-binding universal stress UspA family protein